jgi:hypothetical protein
VASPQGIADACAYLTKVYGTRAKAQLGDDLAKELLFEDLQEFSDPEVKRGVEMMRQGQENVFADGQSIYAIVLKWVKEARKDLRRKRAYDHRRQLDAERDAEMQRIAAGMTAERMAVNRLRIQLLAEGRNDEALSLSNLSLEEQVKLVPRRMLIEARRLWKAAHEGHFSRAAGQKPDRLPSPPPCLLLPDGVGGTE